ncbi:polar amino acid transport system substrate-binding protein [Actinomadura luteofluorescens]|uniref:Polar amino acid transport system substrate-binding protein n=1 Tax=Actinomadura luteofluorescens TaxID=46163 RepID=A0A7Y9ECQ6_9ACTN|nr:ABC transporter substrate-binding protein [Actinomadura luteofluorescens]NYD45182.1 polar amino acid transport system substrate-binding protein [Actinomadura luteofluorescens]
MKARRLAAVAACAAVFAGGLVGCGDSSDSTGSGSTTIADRKVMVDEQLAAKVPDSFRGRLRIATAAPYPPFEYFDENQKLVGLDIDLGNAVAAKLGMKTDWQAVSFDGVIAGTKAKRFDLIISDMGVTSERAKEIDFVTYALAGIGMVIPKGNPQGVTTLADFCGKPVSMEKGAIQVTFIQEFNKTTCAKAGKPIQIAQFAKSSDALLSLKTGKTSGFFVDLASGTYIARTSEKGAAFEVLNDSKAPPSGYNPIKIGVGVGKDHTELRDAVKAALEALFADGTYTAIFKKHGLQGSVVKKIEINGAETPQ